MGSTEIFSVITLEDGSHRCLFDSWILKSLGPCTVKYLDGSKHETPLLINLMSNKVFLNLIIWRQLHIHHLLLQNSLWNVWPPNSLWIRKIISSQNGCAPLVLILQMVSSLLRCLSPSSNTQCLCYSQLYYSGYTAHSTMNSRDDSNYACPILGRGLIQCFSAVLVVEIPSLEINWHFRKTTTKNLPHLNESRTITEPYAASDVCLSR